MDNYQLNKEKRKQSRKKWNRKYKEKNREKVRCYKENWQNTYRRKHIISYNGKKPNLIGNKRDYPIDCLCEICHIQKKLVYHHWDDLDISKGVWICVRCHMTIHYVQINQIENIFADFSCLKNCVEQKLEVRIKGN